MSCSGPMNGVVAGIASTARVGWIIFECQAPKNRWTVTGVPAGPLLLALVEDDVAVGSGRQTH